MRVELDATDLLERIETEQLAHRYDQRASIRLTKPYMAALERLAARTNIAYTRLAAIFVEAALETLGALDETEPKPTKKRA